MNVGFDPRSVPPFAGRPHQYRIGGGLHKPGLPAAADAECAEAISTGASNITAVHDANCASATTRRMKSWLRGTRRASWRCPPALPSRAREASRADVTRDDMYVVRGAASPSAGQSAHCETARNQKPDCRIPVNTQVIRVQVAMVLVGVVLGSGFQHGSVVREGGGAFVERFDASGVGVDGRGEFTASLTDFVDDEPAHGGNEKRHDDGLDCRAGAVGDRRSRGRP